MIVYRLRYNRKEEGEDVVEFFALKDESLKEFKRVTGEGWRARLERIDCPTDKFGLAEALNMAVTHPSHWELGRTGEPHEILKNNGY